MKWTCHFKEKWLFIANEKAKVRILEILIIATMSLIASQAIKTS